MLPPRNNGGRERPQRQRLGNVALHCSLCSVSARLILCRIPRRRLRAAGRSRIHAQVAPSWEHGRAEALLHVHRPDGVYVGPGRFCAGKSRFPEQKSFLCSFRARKSAGFQRKPVRLSENSRFHRLIAQQKPDLAGFMCVRYRKIVRKVVFGRPVAEMAGDAKSFISCGFAKGETQSADKARKRKIARIRSGQYPKQRTKEKSGLLS